MGSVPQLLGEKVEFWVTVISFNTHWEGARMLL